MAKNPPAFLWNKILDIVFHPDELNFSKGVKGLKNPQDGGHKWFIFFRLLLSLRDTIVNSNELHLFFSYHCQSLSECLCHAKEHVI